MKTIKQLNNEIAKLTQERDSQLAKEKLEAEKTKMKIQQIDKQIEKLNQQKAKLLAQQETEQNQDFIKLNYKNKEFRIYEWENKPFKDFPMPQGFNFADASLVDELVNKEIFQPEQYKWYVFKQRYPKINKDYGLSRLYLDRVLDLGSSGEDLGDWNSDGRVIVMRSQKLKTNKETKKTWK